MKHRMKKKRHRPSTSKSKEADGSQNPNPTRGQIDDQSRVLNGVAEGIAALSIQEYAAPEEIIETPSSSSVNRDDDSAESFRNMTETEADSKLSLEDDDEDDIYNMMTIDLREQLVERALQILELILSFAASRISLQELKVITGSGRSSDLKQAVVDHLKTKNMEWKEENRTSLVIKFNES